MGPAAFSNVTARTVDLSHNPLGGAAGSVAGDAFRGVEGAVESLLLAHCALTQVPSAVGALHGLRSLDLRHNPLLAFLPGDVMASVGVTLESLDFSNTGKGVLW